MPMTTACGCCARTARATRARRRSRADRSGRAPAARAAHSSASAPSTCTALKAQAPQKNRDIGLFTAAGDEECGRRSDLCWHYCESGRNMPVPLGSVFDPAERAVGQVDQAPVRGAAPLRVDRHHGECSGRVSFPFVDFSVAVCVLFDSRQYAVIEIFTPRNLAVVLCRPLDTLERDVSTALAISRIGAPLAAAEPVAPSTCGIPSDRLCRRRPRRLRPGRHARRPCIPTCRSSRRRSGRT